jgi:SAM-dependent methyltransferase
MILSCPFCQSSRFVLVGNLPSLISPEPVKYHRCCSCGSVIQRPLPDPLALSRYYESYLDIKADMNPGYLDEASWQAHRSERDKTLSEIGFPRERIARMRNTELGCANGLFLRYLVEKGSSSTVGLDISKTLLSKITLPSVRLVAGGLEKLSDASVDNLFLFNVAEHVPDIETLFAEVRRVTASGAHLVVEVPLGCLVSRLHGPRWRFLMSDEHLNIPSVRGLTQLCARNGFTLAGVTRFGSGFTTGTLPLGLKRFLDFLAKKTHHGERGAFLFVRD